MPRGTSFKTKPAPTPAPVAPAVHVPVVAQRPSVWGAAKEGFGLGVGVSAGKALFEGIFGSAKVAPAPVPIKEECINQQKEYQDCRIMHGADSYCFDQLKALSECRKVI